MTAGEVKARGDVKWVRRDNARRREERLARKRTRYERLAERDREWEEGMMANGCVVERIRLMEDGTIIKWRGGGGCAWGFAS